MQNLSDFTYRATDYNVSRPEYNEILIQIVNYVNSNYLGSVADIGAGTGLLSEALINSNFTDTVYSIEPCKDMFTLLINKRCQSECWKFINSTSENTTLRDKSIDVIFCAQSFHFFNTEQTKTEFQRILKTAGKIIITDVTRCRA